MEKIKVNNITTNSFLDEAEVSTDSTSNTSYYTTYSNNLQNLYGRNVYATGSSLSSNIAIYGGPFHSSYSLFGDADIFSKVTRFLSEDNLSKLLNNMREEDENEYYSFLSRILSNRGYRKLSEDYLIEKIKDIEYLEENTNFKLINYYDLTEYPNLALLIKLR